MPVFALEASQVILAAIVAVVGAAAFWMVGHVVQTTGESLAGDVGKIGDKVLKPLLNPGFLLAALVGIYLVVRGRK